MIPQKATIPTEILNFLTLSSRFARQNSAKISLTFLKDADSKLGDLFPSGHSDGDFEENQLILNILCGNDDAIIYVFDRMDVYCCLSYLSAHNTALSSTIYCDYTKIKAYAIKRAINSILHQRDSYDLSL